MCTNHDLETRIVILEAALDWVRHEATSRRNEPAAMARIAAIATQVLEDEDITLERRQRIMHPNESRGVGNERLPDQRMAPLA
jgi:hypothetical protein